MSGDKANMQASAKQVWGAADTAAGWSTGTTFTTADKGKATSWAGSANKFTCIKTTDSTPTTDCNMQIGVDTGACCWTVTNTGPTKTLVSTEK